MNGRGFGPGYMGPRGNNFAPISNKIVVKSLEDALRRYADFDSDMVYIDQHQNLLYNIYTDVRGEKSYDIFEIRKVEPPKQADNATIQMLFDKLNEMSSKVEELYGKHNAQSSGATTSTTEQSSANSTNQ